MKTVRTKAALLLLLTGLLLPAALSAQRKETLAVFPFTGGSAVDGDAIASRFARQSALLNLFEIKPVTRATIAAMNYEQRFQRNSGLTDADTIFELGKELNADYVIAGFITKFDTRDLVIVSIMNVESLQQTAGDYRTYRAGSIEEIAAQIPEMANKLAAAAKRDTRNLAGLAVPPFDITVTGSSDRQAAMVLAQLLSCELVNAGKYAVLPRTESIDKVIEEQLRQRDGTTDQERIRRLGVGRNAQYVLSGSVEKLGNLNTFAAQVLDIEKGTITGTPAEESYATFAQGYELMPRIAAKLSGINVASSIFANMVRIEGGTFQMGSLSDEPERGSSEVRHRVTVSAFYMGKYQITQAEYETVMGANPSRYREANLPVENVSWYDAVEYCNKLSIKEGLTSAYRGSGDNITCDWNANGYRLPTEAEWEYAAKGGNKDLLTTTYSGSNSVDAVAWYNRNSGNTTQPVGTKAPNSLGIYDMSGNVCEWCWDLYGSYASGTQADPRGPGAVSRANRVYRGGSYYNSAAGARSAYRNYEPPSSRYSNIGFRLVRNAN
jgi:formylglycine-generating enzyme required for sulfatase activity